MNTGKNSGSKEAARVHEKGLEAKRALGKEAKLEALPKDLREKCALEGGIACLWAVGYGQGNMQRLG